MMHQSVCPCENFDCPADHGEFYVSIRRDDGDARLLLGPFPTHEDALAAVDIGQQLAYRCDNRACWYAYGTMRNDGPTLADKVLFRPCLDCGELNYVRATCACKRTED